MLVNALWWVLPNRKGCLECHTATKAGTLSKYPINVNFNEQIAAIHCAKGLGLYVLSISLTSCVIYRQDSNAITPLPAVPPPHPAAVLHPPPIPAKPVNMAPKDDIIGTTASINVSHTYTTCHASSTSLPIGQSQRHSYSSTQELRPFARPVLWWICTALAAMRCSAFAKSTRATFFAPRPLCQPPVCLLFIRMFESLTNKPCPASNLTPGAATYGHHQTGVDGWWYDHDDTQVMLIEQQESQVGS